MLDDKKKLVESRNILSEIDADLVTTQGRSREIINILNEKKVELADRDKDTLASKTHINKLKADLKSLEEELRRLKAGAKTQDDLGSRLRPFPGAWRSPVPHGFKNGRKADLYSGGRLCQYAG